MCTVSFVQVNDSIVITSNRDEHVERKNAAAPVFHSVKDKKIIFPKDAKAGGTWFAASDRGVVAVLLNGAFVNHVPEPSYRKSRGLILLDIIEAYDPYSFFGQLGLDNIEPFTVILYQSGNLFELRWDGNTKHDKLLSRSENYIWSSSTLYADDVIKQRKELFDVFVDSGKNITAEEVRSFHGYNHGDEENGFIINRPTGMKTFSITQAVVKKDNIRFSHDDLLENKQFEETMQIHQPAIKS